MSFFGSDTTKTDQTITNSVVDSKSAVGGNGSVINVTVPGKGTKTVSIASSDKDVSLGVLSLANNLGQTFGDIIKGGQGNLRELISGQSAMQQGTATASPVFIPSDSPGGIVLSKTTKILLAVGIIVVGILLFRKR